MSLVRFCYSNLVDSATITYSSQNPNFPASNVTHRWQTRTWHSRHGTDSGWGYFLIVVDTNDKLDFDEGAAEIVATITAGVYNADTLATEIKTQLDAGGALTYTVVYSDETNKFTISASGNFTIRWNTGTNRPTALGGTGKTIAPTIGYGTAADDNGGASTFTADYVRIHSEEWLKFNLGSAQDIQAFIIKNNNFSSTATVKIQGNSSDAWGSPATTYTFGTIDADIMVYFWTSAQSFQWWRYYINDVDNSAGYIKTGRLFLGSYFSPTAEARRDYSESIIDPSDVLESKGGQVSSNIEEQYRTVKLVFDFASQADLDALETVFESIGIYGNMFVCIDTGSVSTRTYYMKFSKDLDVDHILDENLWKISVALKKLR